VALSAAVVADREAAALDNELSAVQNELTRQRSLTRSPEVGGGGAREPEPEQAELFRKFEKFGNASVAEVVKLGRGAAAAAEEVWVATEKVDGANFSIIYDGGGWQVGLYPTVSLQHSSTTLHQISLSHQSPLI
jgi:hypothetical protein